jgi:predicted homoserine dehydrogenase-like protein
LPIGLAHGVRMLRDVAEGSVLALADVAIDMDAPVMTLRRRMGA